MKIHADKFDEWYAQSDFVCRQIAQPSWETENISCAQCLFWNAMKLGNLPLVLDEVAEGYDAWVSENCSVCLPGSLIHEPTLDGYFGDVEIDLGAIDYPLKLELFAEVAKAAAKFWAAHVDTGFQVAETSDAIDRMVEKYAPMARTRT